MTSLQRTRTIRSLASLVVGASFGLLDHFANQTGMYDFDTTPAFWLVLVTIVSILSPTPRRACTYALLLLYAMLISYYVSYMDLMASFRFDSSYCGLDSPFC